MAVNNTRASEATGPALCQPQPFVGVCGVRNEGDYRTLASYAPNILFGTDAFIMAGIKDPAVRIGQACLKPLVRPFIHCDYIVGEPYSQTINRTLNQTGTFAQGLQLNVLPWMDVPCGQVLARTKQYNPNVRLVLQAHRDIMERHSPEAVAHELATLPVDDVLFDPSQSKGEDYHIATMERFITATRRFAPWMGIVVAGGLGDPESMRNQYAPLAYQRHPLSCDAFLRLQRQSDRQQLDWMAVARYLLDWQEIYSRASYVHNKSVYPTQNKVYAAVSSGLATLTQRLARPMILT